MVRLYRESGAVHICVETFAANCEHFSFNVRITFFAFAPEASTWTTLSAPGTKYASVTSLQTSAFDASNAVSCEVFRLNSASFFRRSLNVAVCAERFGMKGDIYVAMPKNSFSFSSVAFCGFFIRRMSSIRSGSGCTPSASKTRPKNLIVVRLI